MATYEPSSPASRWKRTKADFELDSPSRKDGISLKLENSTRRTVVSFCRRVGRHLQMKSNTVATALSYFHRFFLAHSMARNDPFLIGSVCLFTAGKSEDDYRKVQDVAEVAYRIRYKSDPAALQKIKTKKDEKEQKERKAVLDKEMKSLLTAEMLLLAAMDFDFNTKLPHIAMIKVFTDAGIRAEASKENSALCQLALNFANDSLKATLCTQPYTATQIAVSCLNLASTTLGTKISDLEDGKPWWTPFEITKAELDDIEDQVMEQYRLAEEAGAEKTGNMSNSQLMGSNLRSTSIGSVWRKSRAFSKSGNTAQTDEQGTQENEASGAENGEVGAQLREDMNGIPENDASAEEPNQEAAVGSTAAEVQQKQEAEAEVATDQGKGPESQAKGLESQDQGQVRSDDLKKEAGHKRSREEAEFEVDAGKEVEGVSKFAKVEES